MFGYTTRKQLQAELATTTTYLEKAHTLAIEGFEMLETVGRERDEFAARAQTAEMLLAARTQQLDAAHEKIEMLKTVTTYYCEDCDEELDLEGYLDLDDEGEGMPETCLHCGLNPHGGELAESTEAYVERLVSVIAGTTQELAFAMLMVGEQELYQQLSASSATANGLVERFRAASEAGENPWEV